jgi:hypothetical protein
MRAFIVFAIALALSGCGHSAIQYTPNPSAITTDKQAASVVEQGFYEDFGSTKPQSAIVTSEYIGLSNGTISRGVGFGQASAYNGVVIGLNSTFVRTEELTQRIYFRSLSEPIVLEKNGRDNRYAVTIRTSEGTTARNVHFRSEPRATEFANALVYLRRASDSGPLGAAEPASQPAADLPTEQTYKDQQLRQLMQQGLPYEEYQKRYKAIMGQ